MDSSASPDLDPLQSGGVLYLCTGNYHDMLNNSISSLRESNPSLPYHVLADRALSIPFSWIPPLKGKASRHIKTNLFHYSPYDLTLFVDTDTVIAKAVDLENILGDADVAMALDADPRIGRGAQVFLNYPGFTTPDEVEETLNLCGTDFPFYNSGVMIWRQSEKMESFFNRWHEEWRKYGRADQLALARALFKIAPTVKRLDSKFNYPVLTNNFDRDKVIYHLIHKEKMAKEVGLWNPGMKNLVEPDVEDTLRMGNRSEEHYLLIAHEIFNDINSSALVICPDDDKLFWRNCSRGNCTFVVDHRRASIDEDEFSIAFRFTSSVGNWVGKIDVPDEIRNGYDYVIVNGPAGFDRGSPGREIPIAWAASLARKKAFVFDYNREWEREVCDRYLGTPIAVVPAVGRGNADLAIFDIE